MRRDEVAYLNAVHVERAAGPRAGEVVAEHPGMVTMKTYIGGTRVVDMLSDRIRPIGERVSGDCHDGRPRIEVQVIDLVECVTDLVVDGHVMRHIDP